MSERDPQQERRWAIGAGAAGAALAALVSALGLGRMPHVTDEVSYTLQARLFAAGMRTGPGAGAPSMAEYPLWNIAPESYSVFPPGWPGLLALGEVLGAAWLVNPLLFGLAPYLTWRLVRPHVPARAALMGAWLLAASPAALILAGSRMAQPSVLVALLLAALGRPWLAGAAVGYVVLARPFDALLLGGPLLLWSLWRRPHPALLALPALAAGLLLCDNTALTGSPLTFPVNPWFDQWASPGCNQLGFGETIGCVEPVGHTPGRAASLAGASLRRLDLLLLGGLGGGLVAALGGVWALGARRGAVLLVPLVLTVLGYALYWSPGMAYGARFYAPALPGLCVLTGALAVRLLGRWAPAVLALPLASLLWIVPGLGDYWCLDGGLARQLDEAGIEEGVLFVQSVGRRESAWPEVGVEAFTCDPMLTSGEAFWRMDPTDAVGGLRVRHVPGEPSQIPAYMGDLGGERRAWLVHRGEGAAEWALFEVTPNGLAPIQ